jgi:hypothetical protein
MARMIRMEKQGSNARFPIRIIRAIRGYKLPQSHMKIE